MKYLEIFAGIGGFRRATDLLNADIGCNFKCVGFSEIDVHALKTYEANYAINGETRLHDIISFTEKKRNIKKLDDFDLLLGGFPCQAFSLLGKQLGFDDERGSILFSIHEILKIKKPKYIVLENVRHILRHNNGETLKSIINFFKSHGYKYTETVILDTQNFGLPQRRSRVFIVCSLKRADLILTEEAVIKNFKSIKKPSLRKYQNVLRILEKKAAPRYYLSEKIKHTILADGSKNFRSKSQIDLLLARTLTATMVKMHRACQDNYYSDDFIQNGISHKDTDKSILFKIPVRRLTPNEALKLQGFESTFYKNAIRAGVSEHQLYKQAGNALSVNTAYALLHYLFVSNKDKL